MSSRIGQAAKYLLGPQGSALSHLGKAYCLGLFPTSVLSISFLMPSPSYVATVGAMLTALPASVWVIQSAYLVGDLLRDGLLQRPGQGEP